MFNNSPSPESSVVYEIMWQQYGRAGQATDDNILRRMRFVYLMTNATKTHSAHVIRSAFPQQQWLCESRSTLGYTCIV